MSAAQPVPSAVANRPARGGPFALALSQHNFSAPSSIQSKQSKPHNTNAVNAATAAATTAATTNNKSAGTPPPPL